MTHNSILFSLLLMLSYSCQKTSASSSPVQCDFMDGVKINGSFECGLLTVPEDHQAPDGQNIQIAYVVLKSLQEGANNNPLIYLSGGPGGATLLPRRIQSWAEHPAREHRDIILFDQRGIGYSSALPNMEAELFEIMSKDLTENEEQTKMTELIDRYRGICEEANIQVEKYNSYQNARDIGLLMDRLGHDEYNLYGVSYGTRLARIIQDMFPDKIRSVTLNSPNPLGGDFLIDRLNSYSLALNRIFEYCNDDPACKGEYPNLRDVYLTTIKGLINDPIKVEMASGDFFVNAQDAIYLLRRQLYRNDSRDKIPRLIHAYAKKGGQIIKDIIRTETLFNGSYNSSMWLSVERYEMYDSKYTDEKVAEYYSGLPLFPARLGIFTSFYNAGRTWHGDSLSDNEKEFEMSAVPTLITVNHYDPVTPPENGQIMMDKLENGHLYILDEGGHGGGNAECRTRVMIEFMNYPTREPDSSCLNLFNAGL